MATTAAGSKIDWADDTVLNMPKNGKINIPVREYRKLTKAFRGFAPRSLNRRRKPSNASITPSI